MNSTKSTSTRPYLIRALHEWCMDNGLTPLMTVHVDSYTQVPKEHVKDKEIVLNLSLDATSGLKMGNEFIEFKARFSGIARDIIVPVDCVMAIYARENGQGMAFPNIPNQESVSSKEASRELEGGTADEKKSPAVSRPFLKIVK